MEQVEHVQRQSIVYEHFFKVIDYFFVSEFSKILVLVYGLDTNTQMTVRTTLSSMIKEGGIRSLWRGNLMNVIKVSPETGLRLMSYEAFKRLAGQTPTHELNVFQKFLCGSAAGFTASALIYPMKTIKVRNLIFISINNKNFFSSLDSINNSQDK